MSNLPLSSIISDITTLTSTPSLLPSTPARSEGSISSPSNPSEMTPNEAVDVAARYLALSEKVLQSTDSRERISRIVEKASDI